VLEPLAGGGGGGAEEQDPKRARLAGKAETPGAKGTGKTGKTETPKAKAKPKPKPKAKAAASPVVVAKKIKVDYAAATSQARMLRNLVTSDTSWSWAADLMHPVTHALDELETATHGSAFSNRFFTSDYNSLKKEIPETELASHLAVFVAAMPKLVSALEFECQSLFRQQETRLKHRCSAKK
jgi:hypothetical protein